MNRETLERLLDALRLTGGTSLRIKNDQMELSLELTPPARPVPVMPVNQQVTEQPAAAVKENGMVVRSHTVGRFYTTQTADELPPLLPGDIVKKGQKICMIETMNIEHILTAERSGILLEVLADDGDVVEYGQALMRFKPQPEKGGATHVS